MIKSIIIAALVALLAPKGASAQGVPELECSCSPRTFQFVISLDPPLCDTNNIESNSGISVATTACFIEVPGLVEGIKQGDDDITFDELQPDFVVQNITSIIFKESNKDGDEISKIVLNYGTPLKDGDKVNIFSASSILDPSHSLEDQMNNVPYFVEIRLFGYNAEGELISNIIRWTYDLSCESDPIQTGDTIGWITFDNLEGPWPQFCPTKPSPSPSPSPSASMSYRSYNQISHSKAAKGKTYKSKMGNRR